MKPIEYTENRIAKCYQCGAEVPDYQPKYCCTGYDCGCYGMPIEPPICSHACWSQFMQY